VASTLSDGRCAICGSTEEHVSSTVQHALDEHKCPLCSSDLIEEDPAELEEAREQLRLLGDRVIAGEEAERVARAALTRRREAVEAADRQLREVSRQLEAFRQANSHALLRASGEEGMIEEATRGLQREINDLLEQKDAQLERRNAAQSHLDVLRDELSSRFAEMEDEFVPLLHELALEFLGVPLQVDLERRGTRLGLSLTFAGSERRRPEALSESQRFFMDIALRMALARKLASPSQPATLYIDTPEGSLDIAYEMRAGRMFGRFALGNGRPGNRLVMTANINTSQLLQQLAAVCGAGHMDLVRMTEWAHLSDVQMEAEPDFNEAYCLIERRLAGDMT
jgi:DNA repair exonuclease SbcCD ATPase subunit